MFKSIVPINRTRHEKLKVQPVESYGFARGIHIVSLMMQEFANAVTVYPIVFIEDAERDAFLPVALLGFTPGENLFVDDAGAWDAAYIPAIVRRYPFGLARTTETEVFSVCIDEESGLLSETDGLPLFVAGEDTSPVMERAKSYLLELHQMERSTRAFCDLLREKNLFVPLNLRVRDPGAVRDVTGCYVVNEQRLNGLSDETFLEFRRRSYLPAIYSHLNSLAQIERLVRLRTRRIEARNPLN